MNKKSDQVSGKASDEIVIYSNDSVFSPVVVLQDTAQILWTWDDNSTSNSATPIKKYGSRKLWRNTLKVTPWSAVRRINIGYDAQDEGSTDIEFVKDQMITSVENLDLVAPYLKEWCSSYSRITSLDFSNFINLETIECFLCHNLQSVNLTNCHKLKRACIEITSLANLDLSDCTALEQVRVASGKFSDITLPEITQDVWHMCIRDNSQITNQSLFNDLTKYPHLADLFIWDSNQQGDLVVPKTDTTRWVGIRAYDNHYTSLDLRGSMQNTEQAGLVDMHNNKLTKVEIAGCHQIKTLDLSNNLLSSEMIDHILKDLDDFGPTITSRHADLSKNSPISEQGKIYKANLEAKGWEVIVDFPTPALRLSDSDNFRVYPNPSHGKFHVQLDKIPAGGLLVEIRNVIGQKLSEQKIYDNNTEFSVSQFLGKIFFVTIKGENIHETKRVVIN